jgi:hypothetical protein
MEIAGGWDPVRPGPAGSLASLPRSQWVTGPGSIYIMAPFAFREPGRFSDGSFAVLYAALDEATAVAELAGSRARFLRKSRIARGTLDHLLLRMSVTGSMEDARPLFTGADAIYPEGGEARGGRKAPAFRPGMKSPLSHPSCRRLLLFDILIDDDDGSTAT